MKIIEIMQIFHDEFKDFLIRNLSFSKRNLLPVCFAVGFVSLKYGLFYLNFDKFHIVITIATFGLYFTLLSWGLIFFARRKKVVLTNFTILFILLFIAEFICYFSLGMPKKSWKSYASPDLPPDHIGTHLGHVPWADSVWHDVKVVNSDTIFDTYYTVDNLNRRMTPGYDSAKSKYAVFFGCSVCYGFGLKDNQTIPYYLQQKTEYNAYNYGFNGWGCHHMLARMQHKDLSKEVKEKDGVGIYIFIWSHIRRAIGDMRIYTGWGHTMPYYYLDNGELKRNGNFANGRILTSKLYEYLDKSYIWDCFEVNLPTETRKNHMNLAAEIINEAKNTYAKQFGNDNFFVVIHPTDWVEFTPEKNEEFKELLKEKGISCLDYSSLIKLDKEHIIIGDGHPNEKSNMKFAKLLINDLN